MREWLELWHTLLAEPSIPLFREPEDMAGVLADFRRDPELLTKAFDPLPHGDALLARVKRCIDAERHHDGLYLVPDPLEATDEELRALVNDALKRGCRCCGLDEPGYPIRIIRREITPSESIQAAPLVEELGDLFIEIAYDSPDPEGTAMQFLGETLYTLAASYEVQGYCLTPLCPEGVRSIDPYAPQVELWLRGAQAVVRWEQNSEDLWVAVYARSNSGQAG